MDPSDWIEPKEAVLRLSGHAGGDGAAKDLIARSLGLGRLRSNAAWILEEPDEGEIRAHIGNSPEIPKAYARSSLYHLRGARGARTPISRSFWRWSEPSEPDEWGAPLPIQNGSDLRRWQWSTGLFVVCAPPLIPSAIRELKVAKAYRLNRRHIAFDVRLSFADVQTILAALPKQPAKPKAQAAYDFEPALWELLEIASFRGLEARFGAPEGRGVQANIQNWIASHFDPNGSGAGPGETWRKDRAAKVVGVMQQAKLLKSGGTTPARETSV